MTDLSTATHPAPPFNDRLSTLAPSYDALLCDVWGVIHNGEKAHHAACDALMRFRKQGGTVILVTNAPRPGQVVMRLLDKLAVPREAYDSIVSSGDVTRSVMTARPGKAVLHIGPERDLGIFDGLGLRFVAFDEADYVVCTGLVDDETETAEDYRGLLTELRARNLFMICGNPDLVVHRGDTLLQCAGALADLYQTMGGEVLYAGKPHRPIYDEALARIVATRDAEPPHSRILAIGDSVRTDLTGAAALGMDCLFVTAGIHADEVGGGGVPDLDALNRIFVAAGVTPRAVTNRLAW